MGFLVMDWRWAFMRSVVVWLCVFSMILTALPTANASTVMYHNGGWFAQGDWGSPVEDLAEARNGMRDAIESCAKPGIGVIICAIVGNLLGSCAYAWQSCKRRSTEGYCYAKAVVYYGDWKQRFDNGWQGPILPYVCPPTGDTYLPDGRVILAPPKPPTPFL